MSSQVGSAQVTASQHPPPPSKSITSLFTVPARKWKAKSEPRPQPVAPPGSSRSHCPAVPGTRAKATAAAVSRRMPLGVLLPSKSTTASWYSCSMEHMDMRIDGW